MANGTGQANPQAVNLMNRQAVVQQSIDMWLAIATGVTTQGPGTVINIPCRNVGLVKRFLIRCAFSITNASGPTQTLTAFGPSNLLSNVTLTDLSNQTRVNTAGWHLTMVASAKRRRVYGAAVTTDTPFGFGSNFPKVLKAPATISSGATSVVYVDFEIPLAYTDHDLRGAIYANVTNATFNLQFTLNPNMFASSSATDTTLAMYQSSSGTLPASTSLTYTVYQNFLDQLPVGQQGPILPLLDLSTAYLLNNTSANQPVANQDNPIPYANFRDFMSTTAIFDNAGTLGTGDDINYWSLQSANYTNIFKLDPYTTDLLARLILQDDPPIGTYYFDHRNKPISTIQYGNMQLILNPSSVSAGASVLLGYESLALINMITQAGSLYGSP